MKFALKNIEVKLCTEVMIQDPPENGPKFSVENVQFWTHGAHWLSSVNGFFG